MWILAAAFFVFFVWEFHEFHIKLEEVLGELKQIAKELGENRKRASGETHD